jgi:hypothetical protein
MTPLNVCINNNQLAVDLKNEKEFGDKKDVNNSDKYSKKDMVVLPNME